MSKIMPSWDHSKPFLRGVKWSQLWVTVKNISLNGTYRKELTFIQQSYKSNILQNMKLVIVELLIGNLQIAYEYIL